MLGNSQSNTGAADEKKDKPAASSKVFVCTQDCYQGGVYYHKGEAIFADKCPPHFEEMKAPVEEEAGKD